MPAEFETDPDILARRYLNHALKVAAKQAFDPSMLEITLEIAGESLYEAIQQHRAGENFAGTVAMVVRCRALDAIKKERVSRVKTERAYRRKLESASCAEMVPVDPMDAFEDLISPLREADRKLLRILFPLHYTGTGWADAREAFGVKSDQSISYRRNSALAELKTRLERHP